MQYVSGGPDVPNALVQAHEDGDVVFFCGAGISYPAGLPGFKGLVEEIYERVGEPPSVSEEKELKKDLFDSVIASLEGRIQEGRGAVREAVAKILATPELSEHKLKTHVSLLTLGESRDQKMRLVTTNFDHLFLEAGKIKERKISHHSAPLLPIPKTSRWDGVVYLHGRLPDDPNDTIGRENLVLSSGDFGSAYLTEGWAAHFLSELFRTYTVCFIGYSLNDPVLRYMVDALAADSLRGEKPSKVYAFASYNSRKKDNDNEVRQYWETRGIKPIVYEDKREHQLLHQTLEKWASSYSDFDGRVGFVVQNALTHPVASTKEDDFVGRMRWALSDKSGRAAQRFADFNPVPSLDWLEYFLGDVYGQDHLSQFGVSTEGHKKTLKFNLLSRPAPSSRAPGMSLVGLGKQEVDLDPLACHLGRWLIRHLDDPKLILWLADRGGSLNSKFSQMIQQRLSELSEANEEALIKIRENAKNAVPRPLMQKAWELMLAGKMESARNDYGLAVGDLVRDRLNVAQRLRLRAALSPRVVIRKFIQWESEELRAARENEKPFDWSIELNLEYPHQWLHNSSRSDHWQSFLIHFFDDAQNLLQETLDLMSELSGGREGYDHSFYHMPSIEQHWQNRDYQDWIVLIILVREGWLEILKNDIARARNIARGWMTRSHATFKRLWLFAAAQNDVIVGEEWVNWLVTGDCEWLWSISTKREVLRLLTLQSINLPSSLRSDLEQAILVGPPRKDTDNINNSQWMENVDYDVWLRLINLGGGLGEAADLRLTQIKASNPTWGLSDDRREEFSHWMVGTDDIGRRMNFLKPVEEVIPEDIEGLKIWLKSRKDSSFIHSNWEDICRKKYELASEALAKISNENCWPEYCWNMALSVWTDPEHMERAWRDLAPLLCSAPDQLITALSNTLPNWVDTAVKQKFADEQSLLNLCQRIIHIASPIYAATRSQDERVDLIFDALNHPIGLITLALLSHWFNGGPKDSDGLPEALTSIFTQLTDDSAPKFRHSRLFLASNVVAFFRVDPDWAKGHLLPRFNWAASPEEAAAVWSGFLRAPRLYPSLMEQIKADFL